MELNIRQNYLRRLPSVGKLLEQCQELLEHHPRRLVLSCINEVLSKIRKMILDAEDEESIKTVEISTEQILSHISKLLARKSRRSLRRVINATGIILSTSLGRAPLSKEAQEALQDVSAGYCALAVDIPTGKRGSRNTHVCDLLIELTGAESAIVANNNASTTMLIINTLAKDKEVIVSRGELIEIGGAFRLPDVITLSGAKLVEVGTTNKTHLKDYRNAITENTGAILRVHKSNYRIVGFTKEVPLEELSDLGREYDIPVVDDIGSGAFVDLTRYGLPQEPLPADSIEQGADLVCFSGDKLLSGSQAGIIIGRKKYIDAIAKNPLYRVLRVGKLTIAVLEATLRMYLLDETEIIQQNPTLRLITRSLDELRSNAVKLSERLSERFGDKIDICVIDDHSQVGGGSLPMGTILTILIAIQSSNVSAEKLAKMLREQDIPVFTRIQNEKVLLDMRTVLEDELDLLYTTLESVLAVTTVSIRLHSAGWRK